MSLLSSSSSSSFVVSRVACDGSHARTAACSYQVAWSINPHMRIGAVNHGRARKEHRAFVHALRSFGAHVTELPFVHGAFDSVFAKDNALLVTHGGQRRALLARPLHGERHGEQRPRATALEGEGFTVHAPSGPALEGGDIVMLPRGAGALLGHGFRSSPRAADGLARFLDAEVLPLRLRDEGLYHLDTALAVLDDGTALVCPEAFTRASLRALEAHPSIRDVVSIPRDEAMAFGVNVVQIGATLVVGGHAPTVTAAARSRGLHAHVSPLHEFQLAGGSAACLVSRVHALDAAIVEAAA